MQLTDAHVLITGSSRNLGREIARAFARRGASVAVNYHRSADAAGELVTELADLGGGGHLAVAGDVSTVEGAEAAVGTALDAWGSVEVLVNNAGPYSKTPYLELPEEDWDRVWDTNVRAAYLCARAAAPAMRAAGWGRVVNLSAVSASVRNRSVYGLAKASTETLTEQLALELAPEVTVNAVAPGQIAESLAEMAGIDPAWAGEVIAATPLRRLVTRREVAELVVALCTPTFDTVTGATIPADGGLRLPRF